MVLFGGYSRPCVFEGNTKVINRLINVCKYNRIYIYLYKSATAMTRKIVFPVAETTKIIIFIRLQLLELGGRWPKKCIDNIKNTNKILNNF